MCDDLRFQEPVEPFEGVTELVQHPEPEEPAERLGRNVGQTIARDDGCDGFADRIGDVARKGRRSERRTAHAGDHECRNVGSASLDEGIDAEADFRGAAPAGWNQQDRALGGPPRREPARLIRRDHTDVIEEIVEEGIALAKAFQKRFAPGRRCVDLLWKGERPCGLGGSVNESRFQHLLSHASDVAALQHSTTAILRKYNSTVPRRAHRTAG